MGHRRYPNYDVMHYKEPREHPWDKSQLGHFTAREWRKAQTCVTARQAGRQTDMSRQPVSRNSPMMLAPRMMCLRGIRAIQPSKGAGVFSRDVLQYAFVLEAHLP